MYKLLELYIKASLRLGDLLRSRRRIRPALHSYDALPKTFPLKENLNASVKARSQQPAQPQIQPPPKIDYHALLQIRENEVERLKAIEETDILISEQQKQSLDLECNADEDAVGAMQNRVNELSLLNSELRELLVACGVDLSGIPVIESKELWDKSPTKARPSIADKNISKPLSEEELDSAGRQSDIVEKNRAFTKKYHALKALIESHTKIKQDILDIQSRQSKAQRVQRQLTKHQDNLEQQNIQLNAMDDGTEQKPRIAETSQSYPPLTQLREWVERNIPAGHLIILENAFKTAAKSEYRDLETLYETLRLLAGGYREQMLSGDKNEQERSRIRSEFNAQCTALSLSVGKSITAKKGRFSGTYSAQLPGGEKINLDRHIGRGVSRDQRYCLRIYFTWHENTKAIVIGHMPDHLDNALS